MQNKCKIGSTRESLTCLYTTTLTCLYTIIVLLNVKVMFTSAISCLELILPGSSSIILSTVYPHNKDTFFNHSDKILLAPEAMISKIS